MYLTIWVLVAVFSARRLEGLATQVASPRTHVHADTPLNSLIRAQLAQVAAAPELKSARPCGMESGEIIIGRGP
jgi:hypothetical protein